ncbi:MAG: hypothetical protein KAH21_11705 [Spirochaetaceae bacterium]|nr:hypothetical protein [Spirochaetaceae bacterium]
MTKEQIRDIVLAEIKANNGKLSMRPCWVARDFMPPGKRLGLSEEEYDAGESGAICERWLVSETEVDNRVKIENEGLSFLDIDGYNIRLIDALDVCREEILGTEYSKNHKSLGRLLKIYDFKTRIFYHMHQRPEHAKKVGMNSKEESYHFLDVNLGSHPETYFGVHPYIVDQGLQYDIFLPYLKDWKGDSILKHSRAYANVPGEGFHLPPGLLHAPGTALTLELQESSDVMAVMQAELEGLDIGKDLLAHHVPADERKKDGDEMSVLKQVDWEANADPWFYENHRLKPTLIQETALDGAREEWVWYNTTKFNGTRITIAPGKTFQSKAAGVHGFFLWRGKGLVDGYEMEGGRVSLKSARDELLVTHNKAIEGISIENTGNEGMVIFKFFGPDINDSKVPYIKKYTGPGSK